MASILKRDGVFAVPQDDGRECIYATEGQPLVSVFVRTPAQFEEERARFEDMGVELPELEPTSGFEDEATVDPRYNSLNVTAGDRIVTVEIIGPLSAIGSGQLELEKEIARAALEQL